MAVVIDKVESPVAKANTTALTNQNVVVTAVFASISVKNEYKIGNGEWKVYTGGVTLDHNDKISFRSTDANGKMSAVTEYTVSNIDKIAPAAGKLQVKQDSAKQLTFTISNFSDNTNIIKYEIYQGSTKIGETTGLSYVYTKEGLSGNMSFSVVALDAAGNRSSAAGVSININSKDKIQNPRVAAGANEKTAVLSWNAADASFGKVTYEIQIDGAKKIYKSKTLSLTVKKLAAGSHTFTVWAVDKSKKRCASSDSFKFEVADITAPKGGKITLAQQAQDSVLVSISNFKENVNIDHYDIFLNGTKVGSTKTTTFTYNGTNLNGSLKFSVTAVDAANNTSKAKATSIKIKDITKPEKVSNLSVVAGANQKAAVLTWAAANDNFGSGNVSYEIQIDGTGKIYKSKKLSLTVKKLLAGTHSYTVWAVDKAKNKSLVSDSYVFQVADSTAPKKGKVTIQQNGGKLLFSFSKFTDNVGIAKYEIYLNGKKVAQTTETQYVYTMPSGLTGKVKFVVKAYDAAGNVAKDATAQIKLVPYAPVQTLETYSAGYSEAQTGIAFETNPEPSIKEAMELCTEDAGDSVYGASDLGSAYVPGYADVAVFGCGTESVLSLTADEEISLLKNQTLA